jgi:uncharacterized protein
MKKKQQRTIIFIGSFLFYLLTAFIPIFAQQFSVENIPNPKVRDTHTYVSNPDKIISYQTENKLNVLLDSLERQTSSEVAVVLLNSIENEDIMDVGVRLFEKWGIGKTNRDNGVLVLFVLDKREIRFEVGYGLEGILTDAVSSRIQRQYMFPYFKEGNYDTGMFTGVEKMAQYIRQEEFTDKKENTADSGWFTGILIFSVILSLIISVVSSVSNLKNSGKGSNLVHYKKLRKIRNNIFIILGIIVPLLALTIAFLSGRFSSFLLYAGLQFLTPVPSYIISSIAMLIIRRKSIECEPCGGKMYLLSEKEEDKYLTAAQQLEEKIGSMDYDVFKCKDCDHVRIFPLDKNSRYTVCPSCSTKAYGEKSRETLVSPTYSSNGIERITYQCLYCGYTNHTDRKIPKLQRAAVVAGGIGGSMMGGGGRGGFGGGSFGGGRSGGGGATGRW